MTSMRLILAAAVLAGLATATPLTCATLSATNDMYDSITCTQYSNCTTRLCTAAGSTNHTTSITCLSNATSAWKTNCTKVKADAKAFFKCLNTAAFAGDCQAGTIGFGDLGMSLAMVMGSAEYAGSAVQQSCQRFYCHIQNEASIACAAGTNDSEVCAYDDSNDSNNSPRPPPPPTNATPPAPTPGSGAASVSTAVLAVLATVALLL